jgi:uncharacterized membrane protein
MGLLIKMPLLIGLLLLLTRIENPLVCAGIWAGTLTAMAILFSTSFNFIVLLWGAAAFLLALGYFALLQHLEEKRGWWAVMAVGAVVLIAFP